jgi:hypothetical protein
MSELLANVEHKLEKLNAAFKLYVRAADRGMASALGKQSDELGRNLTKEAKGLKPAKGKIRADRLAALRAGEGLRIRPEAIRYADAHSMATAVDMKTRAGAAFREITKAGNVKSKGRSWWQLAVARELSIRESGRGFLAQSLRLGLSNGNLSQATNRLEESTSRFGPQLGQFRLAVDDKAGKAVFKWGGFSELSDDAVKAIGRSRGLAAVARAIQATTDNIIPYIERKLGEAAAATLKA